MAKLIAAPPAVREHRRTRTSLPHALLNVTAAAVALLMLLPLLYLLVRGAGVGERALAYLVQPQTLQIVWNSVLLAALVTAISLALSLPLAWLTVRTDLPGRRAWVVLTTLPLVVPSYVGAYALVAMMGPRGMLQGWLEPLGVQRLPSIYGLPGATWALTLFSYPYLLLSVRAGLRGMDPALEEAARSLGDDAWRTFRRVTLPALRPSIVAGGLLVALYVLSDFGAVAMLRYNSFTRAIYLQYTSSFDRSLAAVLSLVLVAITALLLVASNRAQGAQRLYRAGVGAARQAPVARLGRWKPLALLYCAAVVVAALVMPASVIVYWLWRGMQVGEPLLLSWVAAANSVRAGLLAAAAAVLLGLPLAYLAARYPSRFSVGVSQAVYLAYGLPGIVTALSLVFFGANFAPAIYQTLTMLIFAYVIRFMPQALGTMHTRLLHISPRLEEASRSLGQSRGRTLARVTLPLLQPGIWAGAALVFLSTMKELPVTLLLGPTGFATLATQIWSATAEAYFARAAAPSLLLLAVSALSIGLILRQE